MQRMAGGDAHFFFFLFLDPPPLNFTLDRD
jgi:hypothetical protein